MADSLKNIAKSVFGGGEEIDRILAMPITGLRMELKKAFREEHFTQEQYDDFVGRVCALEGKDIEAQKNLVEAAVQNQRVDSPLSIDVSTPAKQLLWAAALTRIMQLREEPVVHSEIWKQMQETTAVRDEMIRSGRVVYASLQNDDTSLSWGQPGSWFYFDPQKNHINIDLFFTLLTGFEHTRAVDVHEIGHSQLSTKFPPRMQELYDKIKPFQNPRTGAIELPEKMPPEEQKELALIVKEWQLRMRFFNTFEDICVNQFAANMSQSYPQDFGYSLNHVSAILQGFGEKARGDKEENEMAGRPLDGGEIAKIAKGDISPELAQKMIDEISWGGLLAFYKHNGMFSGKEDMWKRLGVFPDDIRKAVDVSSVTGAGGKDSFTYLVDLSAGAQGIHTLQPQPKDHFFGKGHYQKTVEDTTDARMQVMEHIWDVYVDKFAQVLMQQYEEEVEKELQQQNQDGQEGQEGEPGEGQPGEGEPGEGQSGQGQPGQGKSGQGQPQSTSESLKKKAKDMKPSPEEQRKAEQEKAQENKDENEGAGEGEKQDKEAPGGKGWDQDPSADEGKQEQKVGDLRQKEIIDDMSEEEKEAMKQAAKEAGTPGEDALSMEAGKGRGLDLEELAKGDWKDFNRRVLELSPIIGPVTDALRQIRDAQKKIVMKQSENHDFRTDDGDIQGRLDVEKMIKTKLKRAIGAPIEEDDFKKFKQDAKHTEESTIEFHIMIDGSGSMQGWAIAAALQSTAILYKACREAGIDCYITMWGDEEPRVIARPDSSFKEVGEKMEGARNGIGSGTNLAPGLEKAVGEMALHRNKNGTISGSSHILIFSDGDIFDVDEAKENLELIARNSKRLTVDVAVLRPEGNEGGTQMEQMVEAVVDATGSRMIGLMRGYEPHKIPKDITRLILRRVRAMTKDFKAGPDSNKRRDFKKLHDKMMKP